MSKPTMEDRVREALRLLGETLSDRAIIEADGALRELERALDSDRTQRIPNLVGRREAAEILGIGRGNLTKAWAGMPPPEGRIAAGPYWLESDIRALAASPEHAERIAKREDATNV